MFFSALSEILIYSFTYMLSFLLNCETHENQNLSVWSPRHP